MIKKSEDMVAAQERKELDATKKKGKTVVPSGNGGKSVEGQEHLAEGLSPGEQIRRGQFGSERYQEMGCELVPWISLVVSGWLKKGLILRHPSP